MTPPLPRHLVGFQVLFICPSFPSPSLHPIASAWFRPLPSVLFSEGKISLFLSSQTSCLPQKTLSSCSPCFKPTNISGCLAVKPLLYFCLPCSSIDPLRCGHRYAPCFLSFLHLGLLPHHSRGSSPWEALAGSLLEPMGFLLAPLLGSFLVLGSY